MAKYKVKNKADIMKRFRDNAGENVYVKPQEFVITEHPPKESDYWAVELIEEKEEKKKPSKKVLIKNNKMEDDKL